ncbi:uncharacterized protein V1518DRAFT_384941 [Limtongia smithiae]|uniref:uncharacterized protein n=1 Tax=Limtongia smithiae TaxID=1125753 RepID=UPI0034CF5E23
MAAPIRRSVDETRNLWRQLVAGPHTSLTALKAAVINGSSVCDATLRSVCWKLFLLMPDLHPDTWGDVLAAERKSYAQLKQKYITMRIGAAAAAAAASAAENNENNDPLDAEPAVAEEGSGEDLNIVNPLSQDESNPWKSYWKDEDLRKDILQDIERTFPDIDYFRDEAVQHIMLDILFVYTKQDPIVSYQQGMHELLAPILWVVAQDALANPTTPIEPIDRIMYDTLSDMHIEADAYTLFARIMRAASEWYSPVGKKVKGPTENGRETPPVVLKARRIQDKSLRAVAPALARHLRVIAVEPQIWGIRWIRLLFSREFGFSRTLELWDSIFAGVDAGDDDAIDGLVDYVCVAMLLRVHDQLLASDYTGALTILLHYPDDVTAAPCTFVEDALYLQVHATPQGGRRIVMQYAMPAEEDIITNIPSGPQPLHFVNGVLVPAAASLPRRSATMEKAVQGIAKNVFDTSEKWSVDMNKYVRQKVNDVRARAQVAIQNGNVPSYLQTAAEGFAGAAPAMRASSMAQGQSMQGQSVQGGQYRRQSATGTATRRSAFDEFAYARERSEALSDILGTATTALSTIFKSSLPPSQGPTAAAYRAAIDRVEYVRKCLLFDDMKVDPKLRAPLVVPAVSKGKTEVAEDPLDGEFVETSAYTAPATPVVESPIVTPMPTVTAVSTTAPVKVAPTTKTGTVDTAKRPAIPSSLSTPPTRSTPLVLKDDLFGTASSDDDDDDTFTAQENNNPLAPVTAAPAPVLGSRSPGLGPVTKMAAIPIASAQAAAKAEAAKSLLLGEMFDGDETPLFVHSHASVAPLLASSSTPPKSATLSPALGTSHLEKSNAAEGALFTPPKRSSAAVSTSVTSGAGKGMSAEEAKMLLGI